jgi:tryptophan synthase beta subunit
MYYGPYGGQFVAQPLIVPLNELTQAFREAMSDEKFLQDIHYYRKHFVGRPTPITHLSNISSHLG